MMARKEENVLEDIVNLIRHTWRHRPNNDIPASVLDTIDALKLQNKAGERPTLVKQEKTEYGYKMYFNLPPGVSKADIANKTEYFQEQTGGIIELRMHKGSKLEMDIQIVDLPDKIMFEWDAGLYTDLELPIPVGYTTKGLTVVDLADLPHLLVAGHPGAGKSNSLHGFAHALLSTERCFLIIIDFKKLEFAYLRDKALLVTSNIMAIEVLDKLNKEMDKRLNKLMDAGCVKIQDYRGNDMPYITLIVDELAEMSDKVAQEMLNRIVRLSRAAGISVICATQRPSSTIFNKFGDTKAMFSGSLCFRVRDAVNSRIVLENDKAAHLPANIPGRAIFQWENEEIVQSMFLPVKQASGMVKGMNTERVRLFELTTKGLPPR